MKWFTGAMAMTVAGSLAVANSVSAQGVTGTPYLSNVTIGSVGTYSQWNDANTTLSSTPTGLEIANTGNDEGGALYFTIAGGQLTTMNASDNTAVVTVNVNGGDAADYVWDGVNVLLNDSDGNTATFDSVYSGDGNGGNPANVTWTSSGFTEYLTLSGAFLTAIQSGTDQITEATFGFYPATLETPGGNYDMTLSSINLEATPEPAPMALAGMGAACLMFLRRRK